MVHVLWLVTVQKYVKSAHVNTSVLRIEKKNAVITFLILYCMLGDGSQLRTISCDTRSGQRILK